MKGILGSTPDTGGWDTGRVNPHPLLQAPILPTLLRFAAPNLVSMLATAAAAIAETRYVAGFGVDALAGMALVFPMVMLQGMLSAGSRPEWCRTQTSILPLRRRTTSSRCPRFRSRMKRRWSQLVKTTPPSHG